MDDHDPKVPAAPSQIGVLAYGSLIDDPGDELKAVVVETVRGLETPFHVEYARSSRSRGGAPTLVPVSEGGGRVAAAIHALSSEVSLEEAKDWVWRREVRQFGANDHYIEAAHAGKNNVRIGTLENFSGCATVLYTIIGANVSPLNGHELARLAIASAKDSSVGVGKDGISYLIAARRHGIETPLTKDYAAQILSQTNTTSLEDALCSIRPDKSIVTKEPRAAIVLAFCEDCVWVRALRNHFQVLFESGDSRKRLLEECAKTFFGDLNLLLQEYLLLQTYKLTDPASSGHGKNNLTTNYLLSLAWDDSTRLALEAECVALNAFRQKIAEARNRLLSHTDVQARLKGAAVGQFLPEDETSFWQALQRFVDVAHDAAIGGPFEIDASMPDGDASRLVQSLIDAVDYDDMVNENSELLLNRYGKRRYNHA